MDKKFVGLFALFFLLFSFFTVLVLAGSTITRLTRASEDKEPSPKSSIILMWPLEIPLDSQSVVTAFVRSRTGKPIAGKTVSFSASQGTINVAEPSSDATGKVEGIFRCAERGIVEVQATIDALPIEQKITVECQ